MKQEVSTRFCRADDTEDDIFAELDFLHFSQIAIEESLLSLILVDKIERRLPPKTSEREQAINSR